MSRVPYRLRYAARQNIPCGLPLKWQLEYVLKKKFKFPKLVMMKSFPYLGLKMHGHTSMDRLPFLYGRYLRIVSASLVVEIFHQRDYC